jgi:predicted transcriptional regulator
MLINDFSQLPVMNGDRTLHGMVSWKSFGRAAARNAAGKVVADFLDDKPLTLRSSTPLLEAIDEIIRREVVLVRGNDRSIVGLVTPTNLSEQLRTLSEAFLLLGEIEHHLRRLIQ